jgi:C4-dicarboxylate-specific signal transduction histidine kinase
MCNLQAHLTRFRGGQAIIAAVWDVTEKLEQEAMLVQTGKMATLGEMATGIAHELNQPLNVIKIGADFLTKSFAKGRPPSEKELRRIAAEMSGNVDRAARIINHLRDFGRKSEEVMDAISINKPIRGVMTLLGTQLMKRGIQCELDLRENLPRIFGDPNKLEQVFINLVINARDAMMARQRELKHKGQTAPMIMRIKSFLDEDRVVVTVSDTGPGVPASLRAKIFEPFFTTKKVGEGTGLGLSISYGIIKQHNGTIEVDGEGNTVGGATFRLTFPSLGHAEGTDDDEDSGN